jgi:hypothetical protein
VPTLWRPLPFNAGGPTVQAPAQLSVQAEDKVLTLAKGVQAEDKKDQNQICFLKILKILQDSIFLKIRNRPWSLMLGTGRIKARVGSTMIINVGFWFYALTRQICAAILLTHIDN